MYKLLYRFVRTNNTTRHDIAAYSRWHYSSANMLHRVIVNSHGMYRISVDDLKHLYSGVELIQYNHVGRPVVIMFISIDDVLKAAKKYATKRKAPHANHHS